MKKLSKTLPIACFFIAIMFYSCSDHNDEQSIVDKNTKVISKLKIKQNQYSFNNDLVIRQTESKEYTIIMLGNNIESFTEAIILQHEKNSIIGLPSVLENAHVQINNSNIIIESSSKKGYSFTTSESDNSLSIIGLIQFKSPHNNPTSFKTIQSQLLTASKGNCDSGGEGSSACSAESPGPFGSCSVTCREGYYACCNDGSNKCKCYPIE